VHYTYGILITPHTDKTCPTSLGCGQLLASRRFSAVHYSCCSLVPRLSKPQRKGEPGETFSVRRNFSIGVWFLCSQWEYLFICEWTDDFFAYPQTLMSVNRVQTIATLMPHAWTLMGAILALAMMDFREMGGAVLVCNICNI